MRVTIALVLMLALTVIAVPNAHAQETVVVQLNHGRLLNFSNVDRVVVAAPDIADVNVITRLPKVEAMLSARALSASVFTLPSRRMVSSRMRTWMFDGPSASFSTPTTSDASALTTTTRYVVTAWPFQMLSVVSPGFFAMTMI